MSAAKALASGSAVLRFMVYAPWATSLPKPFSPSAAMAAAASAGSSFLAREPLGLRVKNANVLAPIFSAVRTMARFPAEADR